MKRLIFISAALAVLLTGCYKEPVADFTYSPGTPFVGESVYFNNLSYDAASYEWNFGDGTISTAYEPGHVFMSGGTYNVSLKAFSKKGGMNAAYATITVLSVVPDAEFYITTDLPGDNGVVATETDVVFVGEWVTFNNISDNITSAEWDFGDGFTSNEMSPTYSFDSPGTYTITLSAFGPGSEYDTYSKTIQVFDGINSTVRITVLEYYDEYPVQGASVILFSSISDWENQLNPSSEVFTTPLGKCVFEGMGFQSYYVDVWEANHDNYTLAAESADWITTQELEPGYIHDFVAYVDYYEDAKKMVISRVAKKKLAREEVSAKKATEYRQIRETQFSKER